jgi:hypothetical protein
MSDAEYANFSLSASKKNKKNWLISQIPDIALANITFLGGGESWLVEYSPL